MSCPKLSEQQTEVLPPDPPDGLLLPACRGKIYSTCTEVSEKFSSLPADGRWQ